jgi:hypothetical protein
MIRNLRSEILRWLLFGRFEPVMTRSYSSPARRDGGDKRHYLGVSKLLGLQWLFRLRDKIKTSCLEFLIQGEISHLFSEAVHLDPAAPYTGTDISITN